MAFALQLLALVALCASRTRAQSSGPLLGATGVFTPIAVYDSTFINAQNQTVTSVTAEIECSNALAGGRLIVGNYYVDVECVPPRYQYYYDLVGKIPRSSKLMMEQVCLADDEAAFYATSPYPSLSSVQSQVAASVAAANSSSTANRKLLQIFEIGQIIFDAVQLGVDAEFSYMLIKQQGEINSLQTQVTQVQSTADKAYNNSLNNAKLIQGLTNQTAAISAWINATTDVLYNISVFENTTSQFMANQSIFNNFTLLQLSNLNQSIVLLANQTQVALNNLSSTITSGLNQVEGQFANFTNQTIAQFTQVWQAMQQQAGVWYTSTQDIYQQLEIANENIATVNSIVWDQIHDRQLRNTMNQVFFAHSAILPTNVMPLLKDEGLRPLASGDFAPAEQYVLLEQVSFNFAQDQLSSTLVTNQQVKLYFNTTYALNNAAPFLTTMSLLGLIGPPGCVRAGGQQDGLPSTTNCYPNGLNGINICCAAWIEVDTYTCNTPSVGFRWSNTTNPNGQQSVLAQQPNGPCVNVPGAPAKKLITDSVSLFNTINTGICLPAASTEYMIHTLQSNLITYQPAAAAGICSYGYTDQINYGPPATAWRWLMIFLTNAYSSFQPVLAEYNQLLYGRLPGGLSYKTVPYVYTTPTTDANGNMVTAGAGDPSVCHYVYWVAASRTVAPLYSMVPVPGANIQKYILVNITQVQFQAPQPGQTIIPNQLDVYDGNGGNVILSNDASNMLPGNVLVAGNINDILLYDVPDSLLDASRDAQARANKVTYYLMSPNTTETWDLNQWVAQYGDIYDPLEASVDLTNYAYLSVAAPDGYPTCSISGAQPTPAQLLGLNTQSLCVAGYTRLNTTWPIVAQNSGTSQCTVGTVLYPGGTSHTITGFTETWTTGVYTYSYWFDSTLNAPSSSGYYNALRAVYGSNVATLGVITGTSAQSVYGYAYFGFNTVTGQGKQNLLDGTPHHIAWVFSNTAKKATLYIDGYISQVFPWDISAITFSGTPTVTVDPTGSLAYLTKSTNTSPAQVQQLQLCQASIFSSHCTASISGGEKYIIARQASPASSSFTCSPSTLLYATDLYTTYKTPTSVASTFMTSNTWSLGFWVYSTVLGTGTTQQLFQLNGPHYGLGVVLANTDGTGAQVQVWLYSNGAPVLFNTGATLTGTSGWHYFLVTNAGQGTVVVYVDGAISTSVGYIFNSGATNSNALWSLPSTGNYAYIQYYTTAFSSITALSEYYCQMGDGTLVYEPPVASCRIALNTTQAYCRYLGACNGNCERLATLDQASQTFVAGVNVCDNGYSPPTCISPCGNYDANTGVCLGSYNLTSPQGTMPDGEWCLFLQNYQVATGFTDPVSGRQTIYATPRAWSYTGVITIPTGNIVTQVASAVCPRVQLSGLASGGAAVILTNEGSAPAPVKIIQGQLAIGGTINHDQNCYHLDTNGFWQPIVTQVTIPAYTAYSATIGVCSNMTIDIQIETIQGGSFVWGGCTSLNASFVDAGTAIPTNLPADVQTVVTVAVDQLSTQQALLAQQLYSNSLTISMYMAQALNFSVPFQQFLQTQLNSVQSLSINPINFTQEFGANYNLFTPEFLSLLDAFNTNATSMTQVEANIQATAQQAAASAAALAQALPVIQGLATWIASGQKNLTDLYNALIPYYTLPPGSLDGGGSGGSSGMPWWEILLIVFGCVGGAAIAYEAYKWYYGQNGSKHTGITYAKLGSEPTMARLKGYESDSQTDALKRRLRLNYMKHQHK